MIGDHVDATTDSNDMMAVDVDGDGDLDVVNDPFHDRVTIWRNDLTAPTWQGFERPAVTEVWPRVGSIRSTSSEDRWIALHGVHLADVDEVQLRFAGGLEKVITGTDLVHPSGQEETRLRVRLPEDTPLGLAQVRVRRHDPGTSTIVWSTQYFGLFVLGS